MEKKRKKKEIQVDKAVFLAPRACWHGPDEVGDSLGPLSRHAREERVRVTLDAISALALPFLVEHKSRNETTSLQSRAKPIVNNLTPHALATRPRPHLRHSLSDMARQLEMFTIEVLESCQVF